MNISQSTRETMSDEEAVGALSQFGPGVFAGMYLSQLVTLGVADAASDDPQSATELALKVGADSDALRRVLRFIATYGVFIEEADGRFRHSALSRVLRTDHPQSQRAWLRISGINLVWAILGAVGHTLRTGRPAAEVAAPDGVFSYLSAHPDEALVFDQAMTAKSHPTIAAVLNSYDFSAFGSIADIGGGQGHLLTAVLSSAPNAHGVLFDLPHAISAAAKLSSDRLTLKAGNFFLDSLPVCDAYLLMNVIHDWSDEKSIEILKAVRRSAPKRARLLLLEAELPSGPGSHPAKYLDILMLSWSTGRERTAVQYEALLGAGGFKIQRIIPARNLHDSASYPALSIFEAIPI